MTHIYTHLHIHTHTHTIILTTSSESVYMVDCGAPQSSNISVNYNSILEGSILQFRCAKGFLSSDVYTAICHLNRSWVPDPTSHMCIIAATGKIHVIESYTIMWFIHYHISIPLEAPTVKQNQTLISVQSLFHQLFCMFRVRFCSAS